MYSVSVRANMMWGAYIDTLQFVVDYSTGFWSASSQLFSNE